MKKVYVLAGDFIFAEPDLKRDNHIFLDSDNRHRILNDNISYLSGLYIATINRIDDIFEVEESTLDTFCEDLLDTYESYLIPEEYNGFIEMSE